MCQAEDVLVSCYYLNKKLEFFGIPSAQVGDVEWWYQQPFKHVLFFSGLAIWCFSLLSACL